MVINHIMMGIPTILLGGLDVFLKFQPETWDDDPEEQSVREKTTSLQNQRRNSLGKPTTCVDMT